MVKTLSVLLTALALLGCASPEIGTQDLALNGVARSGAREALQQQQGLPICGTIAQHDAAKLADDNESSPTAGTFVAVKGFARYAQLDDPTKDWTRDQTTAPSAQCRPAGRKHRYFA